MDKYNTIAPYIDARSFGDGAHRGILTVICINSYGIANWRSDHRSVKAWRHEPRFNN